MSFLNTNISATVAARLTQKGRDAISKGNFVISHFAVGDSEYDYNLTGTTQSVFSPFDKDVNVKYPLWYTSGTTFFGVPKDSSITGTCRNVMPADSGWTLNVVWDKKPIGIPSSGVTNLIEYQSNTYIGIKEFLGYTSSLGQTYNTGTTITNSMDEIVTITPEEQKCIAILHYSESGTTGDPYRFFKYDDYISTLNEISYDAVNNPNSLSDEDYFKINIPNLMYHRNQVSNLPPVTGATFYMGGTTKQITSNYNSRFTINYRDLVDSTGTTANRVGKIFFNHKTIVFDDEEIVASLDIKSKRNYTLPAPKVSTYAANEQAITELTTGKTMWVTYMVSNGTGSTLNGLPCNYFTKVSGQTTPSAVTVKFNNNNNFKNLNSGYTATEFQILTQITNNGQLPNSHSWILLDFTSEAGGSSLSNLKTGYTFTITKDKYNNFKNNPKFDLTNYITGLNTGGYFGDKVSPLTGGTISGGTVSVVRSTDIAEMVFDVNLPTTKFNTTQNPTWVSENISGKPKITEVSLLNSNKQALVMAKLTTPLERTGSQVIQVKIDF